MSAITCLTCNVVFEDVELGRVHYKSDWHRYNLKRKVAGFPPVTLEAFQDRQSIQDKQTSTTLLEHCTCKPCNKSFNSTNAYDNHMQSKKHKEALLQKSSKKIKVSHGSSQYNKHHSQQSAKTASGDDVDMAAEEDDNSDVESWDSYDENCLGLEECLFCSLVSLSLEDNIKHMTSDHGFFLPDAEYISDLEGLITYLGEKVGAGNVCLWCNEKGKRFHNVRDVQRHMVDKGHCKLFHEGEALHEFTDFYDYTSSYPDGENPDVNPDEAIDVMELKGDGFSLTLPSGTTIGHRSLLKYYRQNMTPHYREHSNKVLPKMLAHYKALGWTGSTGPHVEQRAKDLQCLHRAQKKHFMELGCKGNYTLRHHFRDANA